MGSAVAQSDDDSAELFSLAVQDVRRLSVPVRAVHQAKKPKPIPKQFLRDEQQALVDSLSDHYIPAYELETGEELLYLRDGHTPDILRKLRKGKWVVQAHVDLHGLISDEARLLVSNFISDCKKRGIRCVRIVHGKGLSSPGREPVLKKLVLGWLSQRSEVLAFCQARAAEGGAGAVIVLLATKK
jgi:DNA-nicking Smr family endonuclease